MARRLPRTPTLRRRSAYQLPNSLVVVFCEGVNTEPRYLKAFAQDAGNRLVQLEMEGGAVPLTLVEKAVARKTELERQGRRSRNSFDRFFSVWCAFDIDNHPNIPEAKRRALEAGIRLAISNPCIEVWALVHFRDHNAPDGRHLVQRALEGLMPSYRASKIFDYQSMHQYYEVAVGRAKRMLAAREAEGAPGSNPCTDIFQLLEHIIQQGRRQ